MYVCVCLSMFTGSASVAGELINYVNFFQNYYANGLVTVMAIFVKHIPYIYVCALC